MVKKSVKKNRLPIKEKKVVRKDSQDSQEKPYTAIMKTLLGMSLVVSLVLYAFLLNYIFKLETMGCECAKGWRRDYIQYYLMLFVVFIVVQIGVLTMDGIESLVGLNASLFGIMFVLGILFIVFTLQYVHKLKEIKCECSEGAGRLVLEVVAIIDAIFYGLMVLNVSIALIYAFIVARH